MSQPIVPSITDEQLEELEKLCLKVAQGPRRVERDEDSCAGAVFVCSGLEMYSGGEICRTYSGDDADLIVATGPADILGLITRLRAAEKDAARYRFIKDNCDRRWDIMYEDVEIIVNAQNFDDCEDLDGLIDAAMEQTK